MSFGELVGLILICGFILAVMVDKLLESRRREQVHRERLAMIEKGIVPAPESNPEKFEAIADASKAAAWAATTGSLNARRLARRDHEPRYAARGFGVLLIAVACGVGLMLYTLTGRKEAVGVGGLIFFIGLGFLVISLMPRPPRIPEPPRDAGGPQQH